MNTTDRTGPVRATSSSPLCPACKAAEVRTTAKSPDENSYWRCERCGEVWNDARRRIDPDRTSRRSAW